MLMSSDWVDLRLLVGQMLHVHVHGLGGLQGVGDAYDQGGGEHDDA